MQHSPQEILSLIINHRRDPLDWVNFMLVCKRLHRKIYPIYAFKRFKFIRFYDEKIPSCILNKPGVKCFYTYKGVCREILSTNERLVYDHFQFGGFMLYKTHGIFLSSLCIEDRNLAINYENVLSILCSNRSKSFARKVRQLMKQGNHIRPVSGMSSYTITKESIKSYTEYYPGILGIFEKEKISTYAKSGIGMNTSPHYAYLSYSYPVTLNYCRFCGAEYSEEEYESYENYSSIHYGKGEKYSIM